MKSTPTARVSPILSIIIPTLNNVAFTSQCLASIARNSGEIPYEIIVVDNGSSDETLSFLGSHTPGSRRAKSMGANPPVNITILHNPIPHALAASWNMGVDAATGKYLIISNNDVIYAPGAIAGMMAAADRAHVGVVLPLSPMNVNTALPEIAKEVSDPGVCVSNLLAVEAWQNARSPSHNIHFIRHPYIRQGGYSFLLTRDCWARVGRFDEEYDLTGEDYDYFKRALRWYKIVQVEDAYVEHFGKSSCEWLGDYHERLGRNRFRLAEKQDHQFEYFSVIIPTFNRVDALKAAIDSVLAQSFPHWKMYVIDDGSNDWDRVQRLAQNYMGNEAGRIWFYHLPKNMGPGAARNFGLERSRGKYVAFLDSDDIWFPNHLSNHFEAHEESDRVMVYSDPDFAWRWWDENNHAFLHHKDKHPTIDYFGAFDAERLKKGNYIQTSSVSVFGDTARSCRFNDRRIEEDWDYFKDVSAHGTVHHVPEVTCRYHIAKNPESEHLVSRFLGDKQSETGWEARKSVVVPHNVSDTALLGVVIPTRDRPALLARAVASAVVASGVPVCVVDDASSDVHAVQYTVQVNPECSLIRTDTHKGVSWARNRGIEYLPVQWIAFLDDDDLFLADYAAKFRLHICDDWDVLIAESLLGSGGALVSNSDVYTSQMCIRRSVLLAAGSFDENVDWAEERELLVRLERGGARVKRLAFPTVIRPQMGGSGNPGGAARSTGSVPELDIATLRGRQPNGRQG